MIVNKLKGLMFLGVSCLLLWSCGKDNYDAPSSTISGFVTYQGKPLQLKGTDQAIQLQLYQMGYELNDHIPVYVNQNGEFNVKTFDGNYKLITRDNNGPWENSQDTLDITLNGSQADLKLEVTPYFWVNSSEITLEGDNVLKAILEAEKIIAEAEVDYIMVLVNNTQFVDNQTNVFRKDIQGEELSLEFKEQLGDLADKHPSLFARVGILAKGSDQAIYSEVVKLK